jgi:AcrR family transcriptional regulator
MKIDTWIKAGYDLLATEGSEGVKIERLARILQLNKSGFYHYFNTTDSFFRCLLNYHVRMADVVAAALSHCNTIDDVLLVVVRYKMFFLIESQLLGKNRIPHFQFSAQEAGKIIDEELVSLWDRAGDIQYERETVMAYLNIIRHFFYVRITADEICYDFLLNLATETRCMLEKLNSDRHVH